MSNIGAGTGSSYPASLDTQTTPEVNSPNITKTKARAEVPNDLAAAVIAVETTLGTNPQGVLSDVKTFLQTEHGTNGVHLTSKVVTPVTYQSSTNIYAVDSGSVNAYAASFNPTIAALATGMHLRIKITNTNTSTTPTLNVDGTGAKAIVRDSNTALIIGDLLAGQFAEFTYNGTQWVLINPSHGSAYLDAQSSALALANIGAGNITGTYIANGTVEWVNAGTTFRRTLLQGYGAFGATPDPEYFATGAYGLGSPGEADTVVPVGGVIRSLYLNVISATVPGGNYTITVYVNNVATAITTGLITTTGKVTITGSVGVTAGDLVCIYIGKGTSTGIKVAWLLEMSHN